MQYNPQEIEKKWQEKWEKEWLWKAEDFSKKPKKYILIEFPYPSGSGLHVGHVRSYAALDAVARKARMEGFNVLYPIGWDAFGLPTENYALKMGVHPSVVTKENIENYKRQLKSLGLSFDWSREINTTDPKYYKWTQWIFLKLFEKGLAYQAEIPINWCSSCKIGLANEEVIDGKCERCHTPVKEKTLKQWMIKITEYADRLIEDLEKVDFPERVKTQQINWIGRGEGTEIIFKIKDSDKSINVFTTRADTIFGVTAIVLAPQNPLVKEIIKEENKKEVVKYIEESKKKTEFARIEMEKEKTGVFSGSYCINPLNGEEVPIWVGDYIVASYGGGAVMMVPAHDFRDWDFAKKYKLDIKPVVISEKNIISPELGRAYVSREELRNDKHYDSIISAVSKSIVVQGAITDYGFLINSGDFNDLESKEAIGKITEWLEKKGLGKKTVKYKLRDWVFSRQHYWGEPIPIIHCEKCGSTGSPQAIPVLEKDLPVELPYVEKYQPTGTGESPLANIAEWVNVKCPKCGGKAKGETDTMPNWAGSNWYFMRYCDPQNDKVLADRKKLDYWMPVDWYNGGFEHTTLHLLYSRFIYKFLFDIGVAPAPEPYQKRTSHGIVLAEDGRKMSKSFGNVINPDEIVKEFGADSLRMYEMFIGPFDQAISWNTNGLKGCYRFLNGLWDFAETLINSGVFEKMGTSSEGLKILNKTIKKVSNDIDNARFNTAVSSLMKLLNYFREERQEALSRNIETMGIAKKDFAKILLIVSPFAPHIAEELWQKVGHQKSIAEEKWPESELMAEQNFPLIIQINGKVRDTVEVDIDINEEEALKLAISQKKIENWIAGKEIKKVIFVPNKLINIVV